jgi:hypothetical protein
MAPSITVLIASHKPYWMPRDPVYQPIFVGSANSSISVPSGWIRDDDRRDNISIKNPSFCELTALYWGWKNIDSDYIGLVHYRRHFAKRSGIGLHSHHIIDGFELQKQLAASPVILPKQRNYYIETNSSQYTHAHHSQDLIAVRKILAELSPEYVPAFDQYMHETHGHRFNMMVMRRDILNAYCDWLFTILFQLESELDITNYSENDRRVFGFVAERLLDPWLRTNIIPYKELPVVHLESQHWPSKIVRFLVRKARKSR